MSLSVVILTFNSEATIGATLASARRVSDDVHVVDSGSTDRTIAIAETHGAQIARHTFESYGAQRNWAIDSLPLRHGWELHLDADERLSDELADAIADLQARGFAGPAVGYFIPRLVHFLGRPIRHGGMYPIWHMRLFRRGRGRCEARRYDQHFYVDGPTARLAFPMIDDIRTPLGEWVIRHNRWADAEADELMHGGTDGRVAARFGGNPVERKRALRGSYNRLPRFGRAFLLFFYRYVLRAGFLDGRPGLIFFVLQTFWFRFLVDAKIYEREREGAGLA
ncbi:MAG TPA: glycosyltransferase family 2 protein [Candidatus Sulfotelmatobacter sp.]|nr:glycosyltransferase family 2 protein [Candidatus Sulfotelmatobacter sp.]